MRICVLKETDPRERRVALVPDSVKRLAAAGHEVVVERGAGAPDAAVADAVASVVIVSFVTTKAVSFVMAELSVLSV